MSFRVEFISWVGLVVCLIATSALAASSQETDTPVQINSVELEVRSEEGLVEFRKSVEVEQGTFAMQTDLLRARYGADGKTVEELEAEGNVRFQDQSRSGSARFAHYAVPTSTLTMWGEAVVRDGNSILQGTQIKYSTRNGRLQVKQAQTQFYRQDLTGATKP